MSSLSNAPCSRCGYNGPGYYQSETHSCVEKLTPKPAWEKRLPKCEYCGHPVCLHISENGESYCGQIDCICKEPAPTAEPPKPEELEDEVVRLLTELRAKLGARVIDLTPEASEVLHRNLWRLYE